MAGFEPATLCSQSRYATKLRYIPLFTKEIILEKGIEIKKFSPNKKRSFFYAFFVFHLSKCLFIGMVTLQTNNLSELNDVFNENK